MKRKKIIIISLASAIILSISGLVITQIMSDNIDENTIVEIKKIPITEEEKIFLNDKLILEHLISKYVGKSTMSIENLHSYIEALKNENFESLKGEEEFLLAYYNYIANNITNINYEDVVKYIKENNIKNKNIKDLTVLDKLYLDYSYYQIRNGSLNIVDFNNYDINEETLSKYAQYDKSKLKEKYELIKNESFIHTNKLTKEEKDLLILYLIDENIYKINTNEYNSISKNNDFSDSLTAQEVADLLTDNYKDFTDSIENFTHNSQKQNNSNNVSSYEELKKSYGISTTYKNNDSETEVDKKVIIMIDNMRVEEIEKFIQPILNQDKKSLEENHLLYIYARKSIGNMNKDELKKIIENLSSKTNLNQLEIYELEFAKQYLN